MLEIDPFVLEVLGSFYKPETITTRSFNSVGDPKNNRFNAVIIFPEYYKMLIPIDHVSGAQMYPPIYELGYLAVAKATQRGTIDFPLSYDDYLGKKADVIVTNFTARHKQMLRVGEEAFLELGIDRFKTRGNISIADFGFDGFIRGEMKCILKT